MHLSTHSYKVYYHKDMHVFSHILFPMYLMLFFASYIDKGNSLFTNNIFPSISKSSKKFLLDHSCCSMWLILRERHIWRKMGKFQSGVKWEQQYLPFKLVFLLLRANDRLGVWGAMPSSSTVQGYFWNFIT